jgi:hypothetical protein
MSPCHPGLPAGSHGIRHCPSAVEATRSRAGAVGLPSMAPRVGGQPEYGGNVPLRQETPVQRAVTPYQPIAVNRVFTATVAAATCGNAAPNEDQVPAFTAVACSSHIPVRPLVLSVIEQCVDDLPHLVAALVAADGGALGLPGGDHGLDQRPAFVG